MTIQVQEARERIVAAHVLLSQRLGNLLLSAEIASQAQVELEKALAALKETR